MSENIPRPISRVYRGDPVEAKWANNIKAHIEAITGITDEVDNYYEKLQEAVDNLEIKVENIDVQEQVVTYTQELAAAIEALNTELENSKKQLEEADKALTEDLMNGVAQVEARVDALPEEVKVIAHEVVANSVVVAPPNLVTNPTFKNDAQHWTINGNADLRFENDVVYAEGSSTRFYQSDDAKVPVEAGTSLKASIVYKGEWTGTWGLTMGCVYYTHEHEEISQDIQPVGRAPQDENWHSFSFISVVPENAAYLSARIGLGGSFIKGVVRNPRIVYATDASMIVEGSISADHIRFELGEVTGELTANRIKGGSLDFENIEVKNFRGENIEGGKIKADLIQANTFTHLGTSILGNVPGTTIPQWVELVGPYDDDASPSPFSGRYIEGTENVVPEFIPVTIRQNTKYRAQVWVPEDQGTFKWLALNFINLTPGATDEFVLCRINTVYEPDRAVNGWRQMYATFEFPKDWETAALYNLFESTGKEMIISGLEVTEDYAHQEDMFKNLESNYDEMAESLSGIRGQVDGFKEWVTRQVGSTNMRFGYVKDLQHTAHDSPLVPDDLYPGVPYLSNNTEDSLDVVYFTKKDSGPIQFGYELVKQHDRVFPVEQGRETVYFWVNSQFDKNLLNQTQKPENRIIDHPIGSTPLAGTIIQLPSEYTSGRIYTLEGRVRLLSANRGSRYKFSLVTQREAWSDISDSVREYTDLGPFTPLGDGRRTIDLNSGSFTLVPGTKAFGLQASTDSTKSTAQILDNNGSYITVQGELII